MNTYRNIIRLFRDKKILVIGDIILDHYIWGKVSRLSPEAPVPVVEVTHESFKVGGAANVAHNIISMGGMASVIAITGQDRAGEALVSMLEKEGVDCGGVVETSRPTTIKTRVIAHNQQVVRFDREEKNSVRGKLLRDIIGRMDAAFSNIDAVIISDYKKGLVSHELAQEVIRRSKAHGLFVAVDPKVGHFNFYKGAAVITPNVMEASDGSGIEIKDEASLEKAGKKLLRGLRCKAVLITRGEEGMSLFREDGITHIPTVAKKVYDVTGAGDTVIAAFTASYASGASMEDAAVIANHAAGIVVGEVGTAAATPKQMLSSFR